MNLIVLNSSIPDRLPTGGKTQVLLQSYNGILKVWRGSVCLVDLYEPRVTFKCKGKKNILCVSGMSLEPQSDGLTCLFRYVELTLDHEARRRKAA